MKTVSDCAKVLSAGIVAVAILSMLMCGYSLMPVHSENKKGNTDYVWQPNSVWVKMTEGISWGKFDSNGYNNLKTHNNADIVVLGSSHMEATNVMQNENAAYLLEKNLKGKYSVYNMGISGHNFIKVCQYLPKNLERSPKIAVIETSGVSINGEQTESVLNSTVEHTKSYSTGIIGVLQKIPFFRVVYTQMVKGLAELFIAAPSEKTTAYNAAVEIDMQAYDSLFEYISSLEKKYGTKIIIVYHPMESLNENGKIEFKDDGSLTAFSTSAEKHGVSFVDMTPYFRKMYYSQHKAAHGFVTGKLCSGHLNKYGHTAIAEALTEKINSLDTEGKICK